MKTKPKGETPTGPALKQSFYDKKPENNPPRNYQTNTRKCKGIHRFSIDIKITLNLDIYLTDY